jgi:hypothetical protein
MAVGASVQSYILDGGGGRGVNLRQACTVGLAGTPVAPSLPVLKPPLIILFDHFAVEIREGI